MSVSVPADNTVYKPVEAGGGDVDGRCGGEEGSAGDVEQIAGRSVPVELERAAGDAEAVGERVWMSPAVRPGYDAGAAQDDVAAIAGAGESSAGDIVGRGDR